MPVEKRNNINARQIKAARALLDWSQEDLASASGLSIATIRKIESGSISPRDKTMNGIRVSLESAGLEFLDRDGVIRKRDDIITYEGYDGAISFFNDVYKSSLERDPNIVIVCPDADTFFTKALRDYKPIHVNRMTDIYEQVTVRCILTKNAKSFPGASYCEYRFLSQALIDSAPFYIYGDKCSIRLFDNENYLRIIVVRSQELADTFRRQFDSMWEKAAPVSIPPQKAAQGIRKTNQTRSTGQS